MSQSRPGRREVAYRLFAAEFDDAEFSYSESDEERAPNYVVSPTGARVNRLFAAGVLTAVDDVNPEMVRGRVVDPTGAFVTYAGQYQPEALAFLERADPPAFLALSGKARTFEPDDGDRVYSSVRPESVSEVSSETRDRWVVTTAERTLERIGIVAAAIDSDLGGDRLLAALVEADVDDRLADGVVLALDYYGTTPAYLAALREVAIEAVRVVADEVDEVGSLDVAPGEADGGVDARSLATLELSEPAEPLAGDSEAAPAGGSVEASTGDSTSADDAASSGTEPTAETDVLTESDADEDVTAAADTEPDASVAETSAEPEEGAVSGTDPTPDDDEADTAPADETTPDDDEADTAPADETTPDDDEAAGVDEDDVAAVDEELEDFDPGEFDLDEEERREVEEEYGTEFSTAGEVESPGTDAADEPAESVGDAPAEGAGEEDAVGGTESADAADVDLEDAVVETMEALDDGDGADREALVSRVADEYGVDADDVDDAVQGALMGGRCYEPSDGVLKSI